jgi:beta-barrel assembly-enhancing protease
MTRTILTLLTLALAAPIAGCNASGGLDTQQLTPILGQQNAHAIGGVVHGWNAMTLGPAQENAIGEAVGVAITNRFPLVPNDDLQKYVILVGLNVANASSNPGAPWIFGVIDSPDINAFSGPNGYVFITRGALRQMKDEAELAGVLAHEIGHVCAHDGLEQVKAAELRGAGQDFMKAGGSQTQQFSGVADMAVDGITKQAYSQPQELGADGAAVQIMSAAGYDPTSYLRFLQRMQGISGGGAVLSTHPNIGARIQRVNQEMARARRGGATLADRFAYNARLAG